MLVRTPLAMALLLLACGLADGCSDRSSRPSGAGAPPSIPAGPDPVVLRVPRAGGILVAYAYPSLDSALWRSSARVPSLDRVIAFGPEDGYLAAVDSGGAPIRIDLRLGSVSASRAVTLTALSSLDGANIYGLTGSGDLTRFTPSGGDWNLHPTLPAAALYAQGDGSVIVAGVMGKRVVVWRVRPPGLAVADSLSFDVGGDPAALSRTIAVTAGSVGDRIYFGANESVVVVRTRDMKPALSVSVGDPVRAIANTPSGDRLFIALEGQPSLRIIDRFEQGVSGKISLPAAATDLRMDPLGRVLLARGPHDSVFVISLAGDQLQGVVRSAWRGDLPAVLPDGALALLHGENVVIANPRTLADGRSIAGGARDFWYMLRWNGFRARAKGLDQPVQFRGSAPRASSEASDSLGRRDSLATRDSSVSDTSSATVYTLSFATVLDESNARALASKIRVEGQAPRITTSERAGKTIYRVVMGPFATHDEAERAGRASAQSYWIFRGVP